jgi:DNA gyrase subunit A
LISDPNSGAGNPPEEKFVRELEDNVEYVSISSETRRRYLNYAMSVIQSRALPDVRDGLKPVQRRILYVMYEDLGLVSTAKPRKCAKITGDTTGNYHPHGQQAVYESLVRMAQPFSLREPLIDGQGNFGSVMGLPQAAERYTEAKLMPIASEIMDELRYRTVEMRDNYDNMRKEPVVLPARYPNLLVNGTQGIAVGMATNIPPHNLGEVLRACQLLIDDPEATMAKIMGCIKAPDFPLGGRIVTDRAEIRKVYESGRGSIKVRGEWKRDTAKRAGSKPRIVINSVPYMVETNSLVAEIGNIVASRKLPQLLDVRDETDDANGLRIVLEIRDESDTDAVMAYLFKHTILEQNFAYNATCLVPMDDGMLFPAQMNLIDILKEYLKFRLITTQKRFQFLLEQLERRIHILEGFEIVFNALDKALKIIRESDGKKDARERMMKAFTLDEEQTNAVLELQLYRISKLEINEIQKELDEKRKEANRIRGILKSETKQWKIIHDEFGDLATKYPGKRRTIVGSSDEIQEFDAQAYIVRENTNVVLTQDGWVKRVGRIQSIEKTRVREGDTITAVVPGSTIDHAVFFSQQGVAYTLLMEQIPASSGYGEPIAKYIKLKDGDQILMAVTTDSRFTPEDKNVKGQPTPSPYVMLATAKGNVMRLSLSHFRTPSTRNGRKVCRLAPDDKVVFAQMVSVGSDSVFLAAKSSRIIHFSMDEVPVLQGPGKGVRGMKLAREDYLIGGAIMRHGNDSMKLINSNDTAITIGQGKYQLTTRGGKGIRTSQRNDFKTVINPPIELVDWSNMEGSSGSGDE